MSEQRSGRRTYLRVSLPLWQWGEHYLIMLTSAIGCVEAQGAFPWTWHTIFVLRPLSGRLRAIGCLLPIVNLVLRSSASFFPLRRAGLKRYRPGHIESRFRYQKKTIQLKRGPPIVIALVTNYFREEKNGDRFTPQ